MITDHPPTWTVADVDAARRSLQAALAGSALRTALAVLLAELDRRGRIVTAARAWADEPVPGTKDDPWASSTATPAGDRLLDVLADELPQDHATT